MGAYTPLEWAPEGLVQEVIDRVAQPTVNEMAHRGTPFVGVLFVGLALTSRGTRVIEFNVRFGDPETQAVLARLKTPLGGLLLAAAKGELDKVAAAALVQGDRRRRRRRRRKLPGRPAHRRPHPRAQEGRAIWTVST